MMKETIWDMKIPQGIYIFFLLNLFIGIHMQYLYIYHIIFLILQITGQ